MWKKKTKQQQTNTPNQTTSHHRLPWPLNDALRALLSHPVPVQVREDRLIKLSSTKEASGDPLDYQVPVARVVPFWMHSTFLTHCRQDSLLHLLSIRQ